MVDGVNSLTVAARLPTSGTLMHGVLASPGLAPGIAERAVPPSLSSSFTVPAVMTFPGLSVWLENAEKTPAPAMQATMPSTRSVRKTFDRLLISQPFPRAHNPHRCLTPNLNRQRR